MRLATGKTKRLFFVYFCNGDASRRKIRIKPHWTRCTGFLLPVKETILKQSMNVFVKIRLYAKPKQERINSCFLAFSHTLMGHPSVTSGLYLFIGGFFFCCLFSHPSQSSAMSVMWWKISTTTFDLRKTRDAKFVPMYQELIVADLLLQISLTRYPLLFLIPVIISKFNAVYIFTGSLSDRGNNRRVRDGLYCKASSFTVS